MSSKGYFESLDFIEEAIEKLDGYDDGGIDLAQAEPMPSLLQQCEVIAARSEARSTLRTIHHFACTGGTLISKCLFALPNTFVLSEIDPLSTLLPRKSGKVPFRPTDLIFGLRDSIRRIDDETILAVFLASVEIMKTELEQKGFRLVLRDHAHSQFCTGVDGASRPTLREMLTERFALRSILTVRHPLDSFLSLNVNLWTHFAPFTLEEYSQRYTAFVDRYADLPMILYEDFIEHPHASLQRMCEHLNLPFNPRAPELLAPIRLSGDSGRANVAIGLRPRRQVPETIDAQRNTSPAYKALCTRFGYEP